MANAEPSSQSDDQSPQRLSPGYAPEVLTVDDEIPRQSGEGAGEKRSEKVSTEEEGLHAKEVGGLGKAKMGARKARGWDEDGQRRENLLSRKEVRR